VNDESDGLPYKKLSFKDGWSDIIPKALSSFIRQNWLQLVHMHAIVWSWGYSQLDQPSCLRKLRSPLDLTGHFPDSRFLYTMQNARIDAVYVRGLVLVRTC
jgi:hypothetical protein